MEPLFEYYDMHLTGYVVDNREPEQDEPDESEPELL